MTNRIRPAISRNETRRQRQGGITVQERAVRHHIPIRRQRPDPLHLGKMTRGSSCDAALLQGTTADVKKDVPIGLTDPIGNKTYEGHRQDTRRTKDVKRTKRKINAEESRG